MAFYIFDCDVFGVIMASLSPLCPLYVSIVPFRLSLLFHLWLLIKSILSLSQ